jgi:hypothetical protein
MALERGLEIGIYSDCQAALKALANPRIKSSSVLECAQALNNLGSTQKITLKWVKAHNNHEGNERADQAAKKGTVQPLTDRGQFDVPVSKAINDGFIWNYMRKKWETRWEDHPETMYRQTKNWYPKPMVPKFMLEQVLGLDRVTLGRFIEFVSGHNWMLKHERIVNQGGDPHCRLCGLEWESSEHIFLTCVGVQRERQAIWCQLKFVSFLRSWRPVDLVRFIMSPTVAWLMDPNARHLPPPGHDPDVVWAVEQAEDTRSEHTDSSMSDMEIYSPDLAGAVGIHNISPRSSESESGDW